SNLDLAPLHQTICPLHIHHVVQRVIERSEVRIHFSVHVAGKKSELLSRLNSWTSQDDAADLSPGQGGNRHGHCQIGFSGPGRPNTDYEIELLDRLDVGFLSG